MDLALFQPGCNCHSHNRNTNVVKPQIIGTFWLDNIKNIMKDFKSELFVVSIRFLFIFLFLLNVDLINIKVMEI